METLPKPERIRIMIRTVRRKQVASGVEPNRHDRFDRRRVNSPASYIYATFLAIIKRLGELQPNIAAAGIPNLFHVAQASCDKSSRAIPNGVNSVFAISNAQPLRLTSV